LERLSAFSTQPSVCSKDLDTVKSFRELQVWRKAHELVVDVCEATRSFPREELYGLTSQLRRSAVSIPSNIAEGCGRNTDAEQLQMLGSPIHQRLDAATTEVKRMLASLLARLRADR